MGKKFFSILFIFLMCFFAVDSVKAEGHFKDSEGNTGNVLECKYGNENSKYGASIIAEYENGDIEIEYKTFSHDRDVHLGTGKNMIPKSKKIVSGIVKKGDCPKFFLIKVNNYQSSGHAAGIQGTQMKNYVWFSNKESDLNDIKAEECSDCGSNKQGECRACEMGDLTLAGVSNSVEEANQDIMDENNAAYFKRKFKKEADESVIDTEVVLSDDVCGIIKGDIADIFHDIVWFIFIAGVLLAIVLGMVDFVSNVVSAKDDSMKKSWGRFIKRIVATAILLLLPFILEFLLTQINVDGISDGDIFCNVDVK